MKYGLGSSSLRASNGTTVLHEYLALPVLANLETKIQRMVASNAVEPDSSLAYLYPWPRQHGRGLEARGFISEGK